jgi:hypothetical protein
VVEAVVATPVIYVKEFLGVLAAAVPAPLGVLGLGVTVFLEKETAGVVGMWMVKPVYITVVAAVGKMQLVQMVFRQMLVMVALV